MVLKFILRVLGIVQANKYCIQSTCTSCSLGYKYSSASCLIYCPTGTSINGKNCTEGSDLEVFSLKFKISTNYTANSIGTFSHPLNYTFSNSTGVTPIPTIDRGFYFSSNSHLISSTSWVVGPKFCLVIYYQGFTSGSILSI